MREFINNGVASGDNHFLMNIQYATDSIAKNERAFRSVILASENKELADFNFPIPGMSNIMPYKSIRYSDMSNSQIDQFLEVTKKKLINTISTFQPDIIHIHHLWLLVSLAKFIKQPVVVTIHGTGIKLAKESPLLKDIVLKGIPNVKMFFAVSPEYKELAIKEYNIPKDKIQILGNGYNEKIFYPRQKKSKIGTPIILFAGKMVEWKGINFLIEACSRINMNFKLLIVGGGDYSKLEKMAKKNNIIDKTAFTGHISQKKLADFMSIAHVFVLPSLNEPFGLVLLEAMACGCPIIAAECGGPKFFVPKELDKKNLATLIPPFDSKIPQKYVEDLQHAIENKINTKISFQEKVDINKSIKHMTWKNYYQKSKEYYELVISLTS